MRGTDVVTVFEMFRGSRFLGGRGVANEVRNLVADLLHADPTATAVLDFARVEGVSHSFADELLAPLSELLDNRLAERVLLTNCAAEVWEELEVVALMHDLAMPGRDAGLPEGRR
jgi:hypothetical protein